MPLLVTMYAVQDDDTIQTVGTHRLAKSPQGSPRSVLHFGRRSPELTHAAAGRPVLAVDDDWVSRDQGRIDWTGDSVVVTNHSDARTLSVRAWGAPRVSLGAWQERYVRGTRAVVDIIDSSCYLVVGPESRLERGWHLPTTPSSETPTTTEVARERLRPVLLCGCRTSGQNESRCTRPGHDIAERRLLALVAGASAFAQWPQPREAAATLRGTRKLIADQLGIPDYQLTKDSREISNRVTATVGGPDQNEDDLFVWLVEREVLTFDEVADLVEVIST